MMMPLLETLEIPTFKNEKHFQARVELEANKLGILTNHNSDSRKMVIDKNGKEKWVGDVSASGAPDLTLVGTKTIFRELKMPKGKLSARQKYWGDRLLASGQDWAVWYANHWNSLMDELYAIALYS